MRHITYNMAGIAGNCKRSPHGTFGAAALIFVVIISGITSLLMVGYGIIALNSAHGTSNVISSVSAYYASEGGVEDALLRYLRNSFTTDGAPPYVIDIFKNGKTTVSINADLTQEIVSESDIATRKRKLKIKFSPQDAFTFAAMVGDGGIEMSRRTKIYCVGGDPCEGDIGAGDRGKVFSNGNIWANGIMGDTGNEDNDDATIIGNVFTPGKVDIRPGERNDPDDDENFVCLGYNGTDDTACPIKAQSIVQKIVIREGGLGSAAGRAALRVSYVGSPSLLPDAEFHYVSDNYTSKRETVLVGDDGSGNDLFAEYPIDTNSDDSGETLGEQRLDPDDRGWVYLNFTNNPKAVSTGDIVYLVLQVNDADMNNANYWQVYYDTTPGHGGGSEGYVMETEKACQADCNSIIRLVDTDSLDAKNGIYTDNNGADFHFRLYTLGGTRDAYINSLLVLGELHADEAYGATVHSAIEDAPNNTYGVAFVGRRFISTFHANYAGNHVLEGDSFVQELDNCDISSAAGPSSATNLKFARGFRYFCDSNVYKLKSYFTSDPAPSDRRGTETSDPPYDVNTGFYNSPYTTYYGGQQNTPYNFNKLAAKPSGALRGCSISPLSKTYYIDKYSAPTYPYDYNFCKYEPSYGLSTDEKLANEADFKTQILTGKLNIPARLQDDYLPKAPEPINWPPFTKERINNMVNTLILDPMNEPHLVETSQGAGDWHLPDGNGCVSDPRKDIFNNEIWDVSDNRCFQGNLLIVQGASITLKKDAHVYIEGNLTLGGNGASFKMDAGKSGWPDKSFALVVVRGQISTIGGASFKGGEQSKDKAQYIFVVSRSDKKGDLNAFGPFGFPIPKNKDSQAAVYLTGNNDAAAFYAPDGSIILGSGTIMQAAAHKLVMMKDTKIKYRTGLVDLTLPGGPAESLGVTSYKETE